MSPTESRSGVRSPSPNDSDDEGSDSDSSTPIPPRLPVPPPLNGRGFSTRLKQSRPLAKNKSIIEYAKANGVKHHAAGITANPHALADFQRQCAAHYMVCRSAKKAQELCEEEGYTDLILVDLWGCQKTWLFLSVDPNVVAVKEIEHRCRIYSPPSITNLDIMKGVKDTTSGIPTPSGFMMMDVYDASPEDIFERMDAYNPKAQLWMAVRYFPKHYLSGGKLYPVVGGTFSSGAYYERRGEAIHYHPTLDEPPYVQFQDTDWLFSKTHMRVGDRFLSWGFSSQVGEYYIFAVNIVEELPIVRVPSPVRIRNVAFVAETTPQCGDDWSPESLFRRHFPTFTSLLDRYFYRSQDIIVVATGILVL